MSNENNFHNHNLQDNHNNDNKQDNNNENKQDEKKTTENTEFSLEDIKKFVTEVVSKKVTDDKKDGLKEKYLKDLNKKIDETNKHIASDKQTRNNLSQRITSRNKDLEMLEMYKNIVENCE